MKDEAKINLTNDCLFVTGDINFATAVNLWNDSLPLIEQSDKLNFDFSQASFSNSAILALLLEWISFSERVKKPITFQALPTKLLSIAAIAGVDKLLTSYLVL